MCFFLFSTLTVSAKQMDNDCYPNICVKFEPDCEEDILIYLQQKMNDIGYTISNYEYEGCEYKINFDYHVGYISGKYDAYKELSNKFKN